MDSNDKKWAADYLKKHSATEQITVVAPTFEGRLIAELLKFPYKMYEEAAWGLDKNEIYNMARNMAYRWHKIPELTNDSCLDGVRSYRAYPLLVMHQSYLLIIINEILQAFEFIKKVFASEQPDKVVVGKRGSPFDKHVIYMISCSKGLEREVANVLCSSKGIEFTEMRLNKNKLIIGKAINVLNNPKLLVDKAASLIKRLVPDTKPGSDQQCPIFAWADDQVGPKILIFAWADYYLRQLAEIFDALLQHKARIGLVIIGGVLTQDEKKLFKKKGIFVSCKSDWHVENEQDMLKEWKEKGKEAFRSIESNGVLKAYFSDGVVSYFSGLVAEALKRELIENIPVTVRELVCTENIINTFAPDFVIAHFAMHPKESCDVLPARVLGIPTLSLTHGIPGYTGSERDTISTQYYAVEGDAYREAILASVKSPPDTVITVGQSRLEKITCSYDTGKWKEFFGFNPDRPVCIFCDHSIWSLEVDYRHSTFKTIEQILNLKKHIPELQIIFRVHHGPDYTSMQRYFKNLDIPDVIFQISPSPLFTEIVKAADVVISHHTSAITEALLSGVRVIYLCALSGIEPIYVGYEAIAVADKFEKLPILVKNILDNPLPREEVRKMAQPYFDRVLCGNDGKAGERLAQLIMRLAQMPRAEWKKGFQDWIDRIEASCDFKSGSWDIEKIIKGQA